MNSGRLSKYSTLSVASATNNAWQAAVYLRLSREDGDKLESDSIANQRRIIDRFIERNPDLNVCGVYIDDGYSGSSFNRPDMTRLLSDMRNRKINCIIVKDLSRFGRNYHETGQYIEVVFPLLKLRFISVNDNIDSHKNPASIRNSSVSFKNVMNDEYGRDISNKIRGTLNMKRKKGQFIGSFASYGYMKDPANHNKLIIDEEAADAVRMIFRLFLSGTSIYNICRALDNAGFVNPTEYKKSKGLNVPDRGLAKTRGTWVDRTVRRILQNRLYTGDLIQKQMEVISYKVQVCRKVEKDKQIIVRNSHAAIIDLDTFNRAQERFKRDTWQAKGAEPNTHENILTGYVKCADCGRAMQRRTVTQPYKTYHYYNCASYRKMKQCTKHAIQVETLEASVLAVLQKYVAVAVEMEGLIAAINASPARNATLMRLKKSVELKEAERARQTRFLNDLYPDYKNALLTKEQYLQFKSDTEAKLAVIDTALATLKEQLVREEQGTNGENPFIASFKRYANLTTLTRDVVEELIEMLYVEEGGAVRIEFKFKDAFKEAFDFITASGNEIGQAVLTEFEKVAI